MADKTGNTGFCHHLIGNTGLFGRIFRNSDIQCFTLLHNINQCLNGFFDRSDSVITMTIKDIKILQTCPAETLVNARHQIFTRAISAIRACPHVMTGFGGDNHFIPVALKVLFQDSPEIYFGTSGSGAVIICQVEMSNTVIESILNHVGCYIEIVHTTEIMPQPQRD